MQIVDTYVIKVAGSSVKLETLKFQHHVMDVYVLGGNLHANVNFTYFSILNLITSDITIPI